MIVSDLFTERKKSHSEKPSNDNGHKSWSDPEFERELLYAKVRYPNLDPETALLKMYQQAFDQSEKNEQLQNSAIADLNSQVEQLKDKVDQIEAAKPAAPAVAPAPAVPPAVPQQRNESRQEKIRIARMILESAYSDLYEALPWPTHYSLLPSIAKQALHDIEDSSRAHVSKHRAIAQIKKLAPGASTTPSNSAYAAKPAYSTSSYTAGGAPVPAHPLLKRHRTSASPAAQPTAVPVAQSNVGTGSPGPSPWSQQVYRTAPDISQPAEPTAKKEPTVEPSTPAAPLPAKEPQQDVGSQVFSQISQALTPPAKSSSGGTIRKTPTGLVHTAKSTATKSPPKQPSAAEPKVKQTKKSAKKSPPAPKGPSKRSKPTALRIGGQRISPTDPLYSKIMKSGIRESLDWSEDFDPSAIILSNIDSQSR